jgi:cardiolipin synthase
MRRRRGGGGLSGGLRALLLVCLVHHASGCAPVTTVIRPIVGTEKQQEFKWDSPFTVSDPDFRRSAEALGNELVDGNSARLVLNGDHTFTAMTRDIRAAKKSVNLEVYIFQPDRVGRQFADAMIAAAKNGVEVRLLVDAWGSKFKELKKEFDAAGVIAREYRPLRLFALHKIGKRTHRKILVVDGRIAYTGGFGIDERWLGDARNTKEWRDTQVRAEGPVAAQMQAIFGENWTYTTGEILAGEKFYPKIEPAGKMLAHAIKASLGDSTSLSKMLYFVAIESAAKSVLIQNAYFLPDKQVRQALAAAVKRGVDVQVMVPGRHIDIPMVRAASWKKYGELLQAGVRIWEFTPTMLHNKTMVVDGLYSTIGTINISQRSMSKNAEDSLSVYDRAFGREMEAMFEKDRARCEEVTYERWKKRGLTKRLSEFVFFWFEEYY